MLEIAVSDFAKLLSEPRSAEEAAAAEYEQIMQDNKRLKATNEMKIKGKQSEQWRTLLRRIAFAECTSHTFLPAGLPMEDVVR